MLVTQRLTEILFFSLFLIVDVQNSNDLLLLKNEPDGQFKWPLITINQFIYLIKKKRGGLNISMMLDIL